MGIRRKLLTRLTDIIMKTRIPEDQKLYEELVELRKSYTESHEDLLVFLTNAENSALEGDYIGIDESMNTSLGHHIQSLLYILGSLHTFKRHVGEWD